MSTAATLDSLTPGADPIPPRKLGGRKAELLVIAIIGIAHGVSHFFHLLIPPLFPWLMPAFGLSFTEVGSAMTLFFVVSGVGQALAGLLVDRFGALRMLYAGMLCFLAATVLLGIATGFVSVLAAALIAGMGNSIFHPADFSLLNHKVKAPRLSYAFAMHGLGGNLGWAVAPLFLTSIAGFAGWRAAAFSAGAIALLAFLMLWLGRQALSGSHLDFAVAKSDTDAASAGVDAQASQSVPGPEPRVATLQILRVDTVWMCFLYFVLATIAFGVFQNYMPAILHGLYQLELAPAAAGLSSYLAGGAVGMLLGGFLSRRFSQASLVSFALLSSSATILWLINATWPQSSVWILLAITGTFTGIAGPARDMLVRQSTLQRLGVTAYGRVYGFVYSGLDIGLAISPLIFGAIMDHQQWNLALVGIATAQVLAVVTALYVGQR